MGIYQTAELSDTAWVSELLESEVRDLLRTRNLGESQAFGSTTAAERWSEGELTAKSVTLSIETETLPVSLTVRADVVRVRCSLQSCSNGVATYAVSVED
jgi:hypothetical protein